MTAGGRLRKVVFGLLGFALLLGAWEGYKAIDGSVFGYELPLRADDTSMPHISTIVDRLGQPNQRNSDTTIAEVVVKAAWSTLQNAMAGLALGALVGFGLAGPMPLFRLAVLGLSR